MPRKKAEPTIQVPTNEAAQRVRDTARAEVAEALAAQRAASSTDDDFIFTDDPTEGGVEESEQPKPAGVSDEVWDDIVRVAQHFTEGATRDAALPDGPCLLPVWEAEIPKDRTLPIYVRCNRPWVDDAWLTLLEVVISRDKARALQCVTFVPHLKFRTAEHLLTLAAAADKAATLTHWARSVADKGGFGDEFDSDEALPENTAL
jgi:hypothetical protein